MKGATFTTRNRFSDFVGPLDNFVAALVGFPRQRHLNLGSSYHRCRRGARNIETQRRCLLVASTTDTGGAPKVSNNLMLICAHRREASLRGVYNCLFLGQELPPLDSRATGCPPFVGTYYDWYLASLLRLIFNKGREDRHFMKRIYLTPVRLSAKCFDITDYLCESYLVLEPYLAMMLPMS